MPVPTYSAATVGILEKCTCTRHDTPARTEARTVAIRAVEAEESERWTIKSKLRLFSEL